MSVIRVNKTSNYTVISNYHLKEKDMSLKAIGLLTKMLSLPEDWDYSINGLVSICKENKTAIRNTLKELEEFGYLKVTKIKNEVGQFEYIYDIFEKPEHKNPGTENLDMDNLYLENRTQLNTNKSNTKKLNTNISYKEKYKKENFESDTITTNFQNFPVENIQKKVAETPPQNQYIPINNFRDIIEPPKEKVNTGKVSKKKTTIEDILVQEVQDEDLRETYREFIKYRKQTKAPLTEHGLKLLIRKLNQLAPDSTSKQKELLENSIMNGWKSVYETKETIKPANSKKTSYQIGEYETTNIFEKYAYDLEKEEEKQKNIINLSEEDISC